jgi:hypothetical protein
MADQGARLDKLATSACDHLAGEAQFMCGQVGRIATRM